jgi:hypothetical protein
MVSGDLYRWLVAGVCLVGLTHGLVYLWLYRPSRWRSALARDASGWVLALTLFFAWTLWRVGYALTTGAEPTRVGLGFALTSLALAGLLVALVIYRLARFVAVLRVERIHPTEVCTRCKGTGVVAVEA